jgi:membrane-bound inhibitor of C-type lysozyme
MKKYIIATALIVVLVIGVTIAIMAHRGASSAPSVAANAPSPFSSTHTATYACDGGQSIIAAYGSSSVNLTLSDGRTLILPQTLSGSGIRYEAGSGTGDDIVFVSKGPNAFLAENGSTTYANCLANNAAGSSGPGASSSVFTDQGNTFTFTYPSQFSVSGGGIGYTTQWMQNVTSSGMILATLSIPSSFEPHTNFAGATLTVGTSADPSAIAGCLTDANGATATGTQVSINGTPFTEISYQDAGAGNFYDVISYRTIRNSQCYALEYTIHSTDLGNYPSGSVTQFDQSSVDAIMNGIVQSFQFL